MKKIKKNTKAIVNVSKKKTISKQTKVVKPKVLSDKTKAEVKKENGLSSHESVIKSSPKSAVDADPAVKVFKNFFEIITHFDGNKPIKCSEKIEEPVNHKFASDWKFKRLPDSIDLEIPI